MCVISGLRGDHTDNISVSLKNRTDFHISVLNIATFGSNSIKVYHIILYSTHYQ